MAAKKVIRYCVICGKELIRFADQPPERCMCTKGCRGVHIARLNKEKIDPSTELEEKFWKLIDKRGPDDCWNWIGPSRNSDGRGRPHIGGRFIYAYRLVWELTNGPIPDGYEACHKCDNPRCCNPNHIFIGTHKENLCDMARKGRAHPRPPKGSASPRAKLVEEQVIEIKQLLLDRRLTQKQIAQKYSISRYTISAISQGRLWKHI